jgi:hypothetical protein
MQHNPPTEQKTTGYVDPSAVEPIKRLRLELERLPQSAAAPERLSRGMLNVSLSAISGAMIQAEETPPLLASHAIRDALSKVEPDDPSQLETLWELTHSIVSRALEDPLNHCKETTRRTFSQPSVETRMKERDLRMGAPGILFNCNAGSLFECGSGGIVNVREDLLSLSPTTHDPLILLSLNYGMTHAGDWIEAQVERNHSLESLSDFSITTVEISNPRGLAMPYWREVEFNFPAFVPNEDITRALYSFNLEKREFQGNVLGTNANHIWLHPVGGEIAVHLTGAGLEKTSAHASLLEAGEKIGVIVPEGSGYKVSSKYWQTELQHHANSQRPTVEWF